ncbi:MAG: glutamine--tRNA ligase/YqeY domain fusion protein [Candidatus Latescibacteria bacterium]|nr:glutamine--tRNA ligase/YqeY domain fusion protein [Candidatus Latescibacterota bacterium]
MTTESPAPATDFIRTLIAADVKAGKNGGQVITRFPPEPNGYLQIGNAKAFCLNFGVAQEFGGRCHLRFDDTNPTKEEEEFVEAIKADIRWLGWDWGEHLYFASDYFEQLYVWAEELIKKGLAYVCDLNADQIREYRGTLTEPGRESPYRSRSAEENLDLLRRMRSGEFPEGTRTLRAKIDMAAPNIGLRDPVMYRILYANHYRQGTKWCIYPTYDWTHGQSDSLEGVTHSLCSLEFENNRPLYNWFIEKLGIFPSRQIEFARLNVSYTILSKRYLRQLVEEGHVSGWNDPRMPTLSGLRRRGYTPQAIRRFLEEVGMAKRENLVDMALLEHCLREDLNQRAARVMAVLNPLKVVIENYPEGQVEELEAVNNPEDPAAGTRRVPFSREIYIEKDDFREDPPKKYFRLAPGREVRLRYGYYLKCTGVVKDERTGEVVELRCTHDPATRGGWSPDGRKVQGTIHWVSAAHALPAEVRLYDRLFSKEDPNGEDFKAHLNPYSLEQQEGCLVEPSLAGSPAGSIYQFERQGYFCTDPDTSPGKLVFNRSVSLRDTWAKIEKQGG